MHVFLAPAVKPVGISNNITPIEPMNSKTTFLKLLVFGVLLSFSIACKKNEIETNTETQKHKESTPLTYIDHFKQIRDSADKFIIKRYQLDRPDIAQDLSKVIWKDSIKNTERINAFNALFDSIQDGGYCCCSKTNYTISFYKKEKALQTYNVDIESHKDTALFFDDSFQTSYKILLKEWGKYLSKKTN